MQLRIKECKYLSFSNTIYHLIKIYTIKIEIKIK
jgi:hypothetical protein